MSQPNYNERLLNEPQSYGAVSAQPAAATAVEDYTVPPPRAGAHVVVFRDGADAPSDPKYQIPYLPFLVMLTKIIVPVFAVSAVLGAALGIYGLVFPPGQINAIFIIVIIDVIGGCLGAYGTFKWGTVMDQIDRFREEANKQERELDFLRQTKSQLQGEVAEIEKSAQVLQTEAGELEEGVKMYDDLAQSLQEIAGENEEVQQILDTNINLFDEMNRTMMRVERASLIQLFYEVCFRDEDQAIDENEWPRFMGRLPKHTRAIFDELGTWKDLCDDTNHIRLPAFEKNILPRVLEKINPEQRLRENFEEVA